MNSCAPRTSEHLSRPLAGNAAPVPAEAMFGEAKLNGGSRRLLETKQSLDFVLYRFLANTDITSRVVFLLCRSNL